MAIVAPFKGLTYNLNKIGRVEDVVSPPYDVISEKEQEEFYLTSPYNVIRLILGKKNKEDSDSDNNYTRAAHFFRKWESEEILVRTQFPSIYLTSIAYESPDNGEHKNLWGFITLVRIEESGSSVILPHEKTFSYHREDRFKLMSACNAQFSPVFGLYEDKPDAILAICKSQTTHLPPTIAFRNRDGCYYKMWEIQSSAFFKNVASLMLPKQIIIADGHHRYETARNFRNLLRTRNELDNQGRSCDYVMMFLANMAGTGLTILPFHRLFKLYKGFDSEIFFSSARKWFNIDVFSFSDSDTEKIKQTFLNQLKTQGKNKTTIGFYQKRDKSFYLFSLKSAVTKELQRHLHPSLENLDVTILSDLIFDKIMGIDKKDLDNEKIIHYESNTERALSSVLSGDFDMVFLVNPTRIEQIIEVTRNSLLMPRKSTYFYPKISTGLVFNKIELSEAILEVI